jgi:hypothetical protein
MQTALQYPIRTQNPRNLLLVIDLNGTLLFRNNTKSNFKGRENVDNFLAYILQQHYVMIWSSAKPENVNAMVQQLFTKAQRDMLLDVWARDTLRLTTGQYNGKVQVYKQLTWVWSHRRAMAALNDGADPGWNQWNQTNTVLLDDTSKKAAAEPFNLIQVPEFTGKPEGKDVLGQVAAYLEWLRYHVDVSSAMRVHPFKPWIH